MRMKTKRMRRHPCTTAAAREMPCLTWTMTMAQILTILKVLLIVRKCSLVVPQHTNRIPR